MDGAFNFRRFAYKATRPRLTFYEKSDKENRPNAPAEPSSPNNALRPPLGGSSRHCTPTSDGKKVRVIPETMSRRHVRAWRKRWRIPSTSSCSEVESENESRERESDHGARGGLFSSALVSKRRKRSEGWGSKEEEEVQLDIREGCRPGRRGSQEVEFEGSTPHVTVSRSTRGATLACGVVSGGVEGEVREGRGVREERGVRKEGVGGKVRYPKCPSERGERSLFTSTGVESDSETDSGARIQTINIDSDSEIGQSRHSRCKLRHANPSRSPSLSPSRGGGWLTRRGRGRGRGRRRGNIVSSSSSGSLDKGELGRLRDLFPQHSEELLRKRLLSSGGINEAVADILATDDSPSSTTGRRSLRVSGVGTRRLCVLSEDSLLSGSDDDDDGSLPDINCTALHDSGAAGGRRGRGRGRLVLDESMEDDVTSHTTRHRHTHPVLTLSSSDSEPEPGWERREGEGEREGEERERGELGFKQHTKGAENASSNNLSASSVSSSRSRLSCFVYDKSQQCTRAETHTTRGNDVHGGDGGSDDGDGGGSDGDGDDGCGDGGDGGSDGDGGRWGRKGCGLGGNTTGSTQSSHSSTRKKKDPSPELVELLDEAAGDHAHYSDDDDYSDRQKSSILDLLNSLSPREAPVIPGCSETKAALLLARKPFLSWGHLLEVIVSTKGLSERLLDGCLRVLDERKMLASLLSQCQGISSSIQSHVNTLRERGGENGGSESKDVKHFTLPTLLNPKMVLKPYQIVGVAWLSLLHSQNLNAILADEMGLGKTVQAIAFLTLLYEQGWRRPHLIVVPASTLDNWARELARWSPSLSVLTYWGTLTERAQMRQDVMIGDQDHYDVILSTYTVCIGRAEDRKFLRKLKLKTIILDEGHMLKNMSTLKYTHLMRIQAERRLLLTGTPLQNNLLELMSLLSFVMPSVFHSYLQPLQTAFHARRHTTHTGDYYTEQVSRAKEIMRPFILRRMKNEVLHQLPDKQESVERCTLTPEQWSLYCSEVEQGRREMNSKELVRSMSLLTNLRKAANHPLLLRNHYTDGLITTMSSEILKEEQYRDAERGLVEEDMTVMSDFELHNLCLRHPSIQRYSLPGELIKDSGKFRYLEKKLSQWKKHGNRLLLFSQFTMMLDIVEAWLQLLGHTYLRLDGSTPMNERQTLIDLYNNSEDILVFLLSTKAGGLGINLTSANVVVLHDIDFNPYNDKQAEDRCHRVGQTREVQVVRLVGRETVEEEILKCAEQKLKLEQDMTTDCQLSKTDLASLLCQGLHLSEQHH